MNAEHSPLPWRVDPKHPLCIEAKDGNIGLMNLVRRESPANAELIVRAVNNHEALIELLTLALPSIEESEEFDKPHGPKLSNRVRALLDSLNP